jgi:hypothetical protein
MFDGKIGIWAFVEETAAKNNSKNRLKGKQLTALSLNLIICSRKRKTTRHAAVGDLYDRSFAVDVPDASAPCLRERVTEMSVEQYEGGNVQRMLLKSLLRGALVLQSLRVIFANGRRSLLDELMEEITSWSRNPATTILFS